MMSKLMRIFISLPSLLYNLVNCTFANGLYSPIFWAFVKSITIKMGAITIKMGAITIKMGIITINKYKYCISNKKI